MRSALWTAAWLLAAGALTPAALKGNGACRTARVRVGNAPGAAE